MIKKLYFILFFSIAIWGVCTSYGQEQSIHAIHQVKNKSIELRWVCMNDSLFRIAINNGFYIKRIEWNNTTPPTENNFVTNSHTVVENIKPLAKENKKWDSLIRVNPSVELLFNYLYNTPSPYKYNNMAMGMCMLSCDLYRDCAMGAGLLYIDPNIESSKKYAYLIGVNNANTHKIKPFILLAEASTITNYKTITNINARYKRKIAFIEWNYRELNNSYSGYIVERSEDDKDFITINKEPCIGVTTEYEPDKQTIIYSDKITIIGQTYYYRIRGINRFGEICKPSKSIKLTAYPDLEGELIVDTLSSTDRKKMTLSWHFVNKGNEKWIKGFNIYKSEQIAGNYARLNDQILSPQQDEFIISHSASVAYYKIEALGMNNDTLFSFPKLVLLPDNIPACTPKNLQGKIDKEGHVQIHWPPCLDKDLQGYKVYRANSENEEFVELTKKLSLDTIFNDSISLITLTPFIYYAVASVDQVFNTSPMSITVKIKRPDNIPPVQPIIREVKLTDVGVKIKWINSSSEDVEQHILMRSINNMPFESILTINKNDSTHAYIDSNLIHNNIYQYKILCLDDSQNKTESQPRNIQYKQLVKKAHIDLKVEADRNNKQIILQWNYSEKDIWKYTIYRYKKGEQPQILKTVDHNSLNYYDKELSIGNTYIYTLKAIFNDGTESKMSKPIEVQY